MQADDEIVRLGSWLESRGLTLTFKGSVGSPKKARARLTAKQPQPPPPPSPTKPQSPAAEPQQADVGQRRMTRSTAVTAEKEQGTAGNDKAKEKEKKVHNPTLL